MALTPEGTPYVESTDLVANYPAASLSLANRVDLVGVLPFADSAARATAIPSPTDGQFTYLQDTNTPEFYNGSAYVPVGTAPGLVLISSDTFTTAGSVAINNCFNGTYRNYKIMLDYAGNTSTNVSLRMRVSGSDNSTANSYLTQTVRGSATTASAFQQTDNEADQAFLAGDTTTAGISCEVFKPFLAEPTVWINTGRSRDDYCGVFTVRHNQSTSYDGFSILPDGATTITGVVKIYGYKD
jgi:hypothetical protein